MQTLLVVDDDVAIVEVLAEILEYAGYRVVRAHNGQAALTCLAQAPADLVLSDVMMPQLDGPALCRRIQADPALRGIPVILMTAARHTSAPDGCVPAAWLPKPFDINDVVATVDRLLQVPPGSAAAAVAAPGRD